MITDDERRQIKEIVGDRIIAAEDIEGNPVAVFMSGYSATIRRVREKTGKHLHASEIAQAVGAIPEESTNTMSIHMIIKCDYCNRYGDPNKMLWDGNNERICPQCRLSKADKFLNSYVNKRISVEKVDIDEFYREGYVDLIRIYKPKKGDEGLKDLQIVTHCLNLIDAEFHSRKFIIYEEKTSWVLYVYNPMLYRVENRIEDLLSSLDNTDLAPKYRAAIDGQVNAYIEFKQLIINYMRIEFKTYREFWGETDDEGLCVMRA